MTKFHCFPQNIKTLSENLRQILGIASAKWVVGFKVEKEKQMQFKLVEAGAAAAAGQTCRECQWIS